MLYNADTRITDYTSSARFCVVRSLATNQYTILDNLWVRLLWRIGALNFEGYSAYNVVAESSDHTVSTYVVPHLIYLGI